VTDLRRANASMNEMTSSQSRSFPKSHMNRASLAATSGVPFS
jgi:hypothetical protein